MKYNKHGDMESMNYNVVATVEQEGGKTKCDGYISMFISVKTLTV